jgi:hypothetical protein
MTIAAFSMAATLGAKCVIESKLEESVFVSVGHEINAPAIAAIAAAGSASRDKLFPAERNATVTTVAGFHCNLGFVDEH